MSDWIPSFNTDELKQQHKQARKQIRKNRFRSACHYLFDQLLAILALLVAIASLIVAILSYLE